jgi:23S rRNA (uridine2552-2'-O)-methyltransferase
MKHYRDHYFLMARRENYPARSIYKLKELDAKFKLFGPGMKVLDLGAAPGSWSLGAAERVGSSGTVLACDIQDARDVFPSNVRFFREDIFALSAAFEEVLARTAPFDAVLSDMAPSTTGARFVDQARSLELCRAALALAERFLGKGGSFVTKMFMGPDGEDFVADMRRSFSGVKAFKPKSSRAESREMFYVGLGYGG